MGQFPHLYGNQRWLDRRAQQLRKAPICATCWARGRVTRATVADHVVPHKGDVTLFWSGELQSLCASCHSGDKQLIERLGYSLAIGEDGLPIDPNHPFNRGT